MEGEGVITEVLGPRGQPGVDTLSIIRAYGIPDQFDDETLQEARAQARDFDENIATDRLDLRETLTITIDPATARDFDDAISLHQDEKGFWHLGVHIADVSHFVAPSSALDREARKRGNSVYLPDRVLPMLPEILSNSLASLQQGKVRYTVSALLEFHADGVRTDAQFAAHRHPGRSSLHVRASLRRHEGPGAACGRCYRRDPDHAGTDARAGHDPAAATAGTGRA